MSNHETHQEQDTDCGQAASGGHDAAHEHGPDCGHQTVAHGDHTDYLVDGRLHHPHGEHCDDHGPAEVAA